ncbi:IMP cyclohydrolase [Microlunatus sp. Gsoil 973]|uniref:IMP cyclohydrolase n=1 Tax=Microlunatus sp. Gsoil 973 TaxID=2672569 RepID=UPI0018A7F2EF|nr:IMP cyclohydrolase [Microlunatus sp. Gsoil 973]
MSSDALEAVLSDRPYPGRVIIVARTPTGLVCAYAATGRSEASRQRRIRLTGDGDLLVEPTVGDASDPLRHYRAVRRTDRHFVLGNGSQVDPVADRIAAGEVPAVALEDLEYEPDPPIYTPRITAVVADDDWVWLAAAHRGSAARASADTIVTRAGELAVGDGLLLSTYRGPVAEPVTNKVPVPITTTAGSHTELARQLWDGLDAERRVLAAGFAPREHLADPLLINAAG